MISLDSTVHQTLPILKAHHNSISTTSETHMPLGNEAILDTGAGGDHYVTPALAQTVYSAPTISIDLADGSAMASNTATTLALFPPSVPTAASSARIVPALTKSLISIGKLCDNGLDAVFTKQRAYIIHKGQVILSGNRDYATKLWTVNIPKTPAIGNPSAYSINAINPRTTIAQRINYYHTIMCSPALSTFQRAIDAGFLTTFPELTAAMVKKYPPASIAMHKGHLDQVRANSQSTKLPKPFDDALPKLRQLCISILSIKDMNTPPAPREPGRVYSDLTAPFLIPSSRGNKHILIVYDSDSNYIFAQPIPSRSADQIHQAYSIVHETLTKRGLKPEMKIMDNEASQKLKDYLSEKGVTYQLTPPHVHRRNAAERAIRTFKRHFISCLCSVDPSFPLFLWDRLLPQVELTLNMLRPSRINNSLSAYNQVYGAFDFNRTPLGPPGTRVVTHDKPSQRGPFAPHGTDAWYVGPAMFHYRSFRVFVPSTNSERITDTLAWVSHDMPTASSTDAAFAAATDLIYALTHPSPASALHPLSNSETQALRQLATIFSDRFTAMQPIHAIDPQPGSTVQHPNTVTPPEPRVVPVTQPRVIQPSAVTQPMDIHPQPRVAPATTLQDPTTYATWNHNRAQRRRQKKKAKTRNSSPVAKPTRASNKRRKASTPPTLSNETAVPPASNIQPIPPTARLGTRRSTRGTKLIRFDPKTHRPIPSETTVEAANDQLEVHHQALSAITATHRTLIRGDEAKHWKRATSKEIGRCAQGMPGLVEGTDTWRFISHADKPKDRIASYCKLVCAHNEHKSEAYRVRATYGGSNSDYTGDVSSPTADISTFKIHINSTISKREARYMTLDIRNFYLGTPLTRFEYMRIPISAIPDDVIAHYNLLPLVQNGFIMVEIRKGLYGLPQAGLLAYELLLTRLALGGYYPAANTPGLILHETRQISFTLWVDDFGVQYTDKADVDHLTALLNQHYELTLDWTGTKYLGFTLEWDYINGTVDLSMPGYIERALERFGHPAPNRPQHSPHAWTRPQYGSGTQQTAEPDKSSPLTPANVTRLQQIIGVLLYYARMVDNTMLVALGTLASAQAKGTEATMDATTHLLNYCATHPDAKIRYHASDMTLHIVSDASYLSASEARSRLGGYFFLSKNIGTTAPRPDDPPPPWNAPVLVNSSIIKSILSSAAEAELGALFYNAKDGCMLRNTLQDLGYPQGPTPIQADNACAVGLANDQVKQKRSKAIDMRFYWVKDRVKAGQFIIYWRKGEENEADYFTKHHSPSHHRKMRHRYLHDPHASISTGLSFYCIQPAVPGAGR